MSKSIRILVACGSGVATSTLAQEEIKTIARENDVDITVSKCTLADVPSQQNFVDVVFTTANYRKPLKKPHLSVFGLISGVNAEKSKSDVAELLKNLAGK
ncbi:PTS sugar transporter subunit IIB [Pectinatus haikarae]|uniref:PTS system galactitol-specific IIB component n=1 Tax=Pectinatus haikarae TaxID=349096 RepID=A0ABT9YBK5_9FIRM|nr:PTS sugar transporter subunit IIB [Pectinatus haikarae]MDQ0205091.1 PTS system galactitol-specific IIB component [Pectinatus haikarae]